MNERKVEDLTEHLHNLIITNRQEEAIIIQQIQDLKQRIKKNNKRMIKQNGKNAKRKKQKTQPRHTA